MKFNLVEHDSGTVVASHDTGEESLYDFLLSHYPPEFFMVARLEPLYGPYSIPHAGVMVYAPQCLLVAAGCDKNGPDPLSWEAAYVVITG